MLAEMAGPAYEAMPKAGQMGAFADPVFVLCNGRSGSTLLRFILDAHPELACPPETNLPALCVQLATVWSLIEGAPLSATRGDEPPRIPEPAIAGVRRTMDQMVGSYLARRGKRRYCDKSLGTARYARLLLRVYPGARFICVYRHPMDVIASGMEACPWGLNGYGFDPYIGATPGNTVMALASFWADGVRAMLAVEEDFPGHCHRVRYEDLVTDPEATAAGLFEFLGVPAVAGISRECFSAERERFGPADYKIWYTSAISSDSVGRGWSVPAALIAPQLVDAINEMAGKLGYLAIDSDWGTTGPPSDVRMPAAPPGSGGEQCRHDADRKPAGVSGAADGETGPAATVGQQATGSNGNWEDAHSRRLGDQLRAGLAAVPRQARDRWGPHASETFIAVSVAGNQQRPAEYWLVDLGQATVSQVDQQAQEKSDWDLIGTLEIWEQLLDGQLNLSVALRRCQLRYCDDAQGATPLAADERIRILGQLLGLASWA